MFVQNYSWRGVIFLALLILIGALFLGLTLSDSSVFKAAHRNLTLAGVEETTVPANAPDVTQPAPERFPPLERIIILLLVTFIAGMTLGVALSRPVIHPGL